MSIMSICRAMNWTRRLPRRWARLSIGLVLVALATYALKILPYSTSLIEHVESTDVESRRPAPDFSLGSLRWEVSRYAVDPRLEPLRNYYRARADGKKGLEAAQLISEGIASHSPLGNPSQEFVDTGFNPVASFLLQLGGEPGHCTTRSGSVAAVLLASGIPARVFQIIPLDPDGHLRLANGHNVLEVWDERSGWSMVDPTLGGMLAGDLSGSPSSSGITHNQGDFTIFPDHNNNQYRKANHTIMTWDQGSVCSSRSRGCTSARVIVPRHGPFAAASCASGWATGSSAQRRNPWLASSVYR